MRAIHVSVRVVTVRGALSHGGHGNSAYTSFSLLLNYTPNHSGAVKDQIEWGTYLSMYCLKPVQYIIDTVANVTNKKQ